MIEGISLFLSGKNFIPQSFIEHIKEHNNKEAWENSEERNWLETKYYIEAKKLVTPTEESK